MDLLCCHKPRRFFTTTTSQQALVRRLRSLSSEGGREFDVTLRIIKAELPGNGGLIGSSNLSTVVRWHGDESLCDWSVHSTPMLWLSDVAPEWQHTCPRQPRVAFQDAQIGFEVMQEGYVFSAPTCIGAALVSGKSLLQGPSDTTSDVTRDLTLMLGGNNAGSITVQVIVEVAEVKVIDKIARDRTVRLQLQVQARKSVCRERTPSPPASSSYESDSEDSFYEAPISQKQSHKIFKTAMKQRAHSVSSTSSTGSEVYQDQSAVVAPSAMQRSGTKGIDMNKVSTMNKVNNMNKVNTTKVKEMGDIDMLANSNPEQWAITILNAVKGTGARSASPQKRPQVAAARSVSPQKRPQAQGTAPRSASPQKRPQAWKRPFNVQELILRLRVTAMKFPRRGLGGMIQLAKDRFFAIVSGDSSTSFADEKLVEVEGLALAWYDDEAAWRSQARPLGYVPVDHIYCAAVDKQATGCVVSVKYMPQLEDSLQPEHMRMLFDSLPFAKAWCKDLNELVELVRRPAR